MKYILIILALIPVLSFSQQSYTLSGNITDAETGEDLIGVTIVAVELSQGAVTNTYGFYSLSLPEGTYTIRYSYIGYDSFIFARIDIFTGKTVHF